MPLGRRFRFFKGPGPEDRNSQPKVERAQTPVKLGTDDSSLCPGQTGSEVQARHATKPHTLDRTTLRTYEPLRRTRGFSLANSSRRKKAGLPGKAGFVTLSKNQSSGGLMFSTSAFS